MPDDTKHGASCTEFEALLSDAIEGRVTGAEMEKFEAHRRTCDLCGPMFAEARAGRELLLSLGEVEPPAYLVHNILVATTGVTATGTALAGRGATSRGLRAWWDSWVAPAAAFVRQPRFAMSFGMVFFSLSLVLNFAGVKASDMASVSLRPSAVRHAYNDAQIKVVKWYDNIRFVYEIESKVRELKRATTPAEPAPQEQPKDRKNDTSGQPEQRQDRNYSSERSGVVLAEFSERNSIHLHEAPDVAMSYELRAASEQEHARCSRLSTPGSRRFV
ncbi:MAG TPA: hypothetical protein VMI10_04160 [Terriglobales bacterium]|nr:hypothetical protein [Terriglobales bacterium]